MSKIAKLSAFTALLLGPSIAISQQATPSSICKLNDGKVLQTEHGGLPKDKFTKGDITFKEVKKCNEGICFEAIMRFFESPAGPDKAKGYITPSGHFLLNRIVRLDGPYPQRWEGACKNNVVTGSWYDPRGKKPDSPQTYFTITIK